MWHGHMHARGQQQALSVPARHASMLSAVGGRLPAPRDWGQLVPRRSGVLKASIACLPLKIALKIEVCFHSDRPLEMVGRQEWQLGVCGPSWGRFLLAVWDLGGPSLQSQPQGAEAGVLPSDRPHFVLHRYLPLCSPPSARACCWRKELDFGSASLWFSATQHLQQFSSTCL